MDSRKHSARWLILIFLLCQESSASFSEESCAEGDCEESYQNVWKGGSECSQKRFEWDSFVCVCSAVHCDNPGVIDFPEDKRSFVVITSSREKERFHVTSHSLSTDIPEGSIPVLINPEIKYQEMIGYGGAFTDATGIGVQSLSPATQEMFYQSYFSEKGIKYNLCRVPIGGTDFSERPYAYNEMEGDEKLENFELTEEDFSFKIPLIKKASQLTNGEFRLIASPWSPPAWMKTNNKINGSGRVKPNLYDVYANYIIRFLEEYRNEGIEMFGLTSQNEPLSGAKEEWHFNQCIWYPQDMRRWISESLKPALDNSEFNTLKLIIGDIVRDHLYNYTSQVLSSQRTHQCVDGVSAHWYHDSEENKHLLAKTVETFPDKFFLYTEACAGAFSEPEEKVKLGSWERAEQYAQSLIETANLKVSGWIDWNMALNKQGGPNWSGNFVDSPIIVDAENDIFYKQPMFYALGHFSKFVSPGTFMVYNDMRHSTGGKVSIASFKKDDAGIAVLLNKSDNEEVVSISIGDEGLRMNVKMPAKSIQTLLFKFN